MGKKYTVDDYETGNFYKLEKSLVLNEIYSKLSLGAKFTYAILRDRQDLSIKNKWVDSNGNIFFYFDCNNLSKLLNISTNTITKYKKELREYKLLSEERQGQGKPNRMYILKPEPIANTLNSDYLVSRNEKKMNLEPKKTLYNDTVYKDTEIKKLNNYIPLSQSDGTYISFYLSIHDQFMSKPHKRVSEENYDRIIQFVDNIKEFIEYREWQEAVIEHFENLPANNDGDINSFMLSCFRQLNANTLTL